MQNSEFPEDIKNLIIEYLVDTEKIAIYKKKINYNIKMFGIIYNYCSLKKIKIVIRETLNFTEGRPDNDDRSAAQRVAYTVISSRRLIGICNWGPSGC